MTVSDMAAHVERIAAEHRIEVLPHSRGGRAWRRSRKVAIRPVRSSVTYAVALHELGHVLGPQRGSRLDREVDAWAWARAHAAAWDGRMERERSRSLATYVRWAQRRQARDSRRVFIRPDHPVWRYVDEGAA